LNDDAKDFRSFSKSYEKIIGDRIADNKDASGKNNSNLETTSTPQIIVSILPQVQVVKKIVGDSANVISLIPSGFSAETYEPTIKDIKIIAKADVYFRIGHIAFEKINLSKFQEINSRMIVVDTSINNKLRNVEGQVSNNHDSEISVQEIDPHVWLSPKMVRQQAEVIKNSLVEIYPDNKEFYERNYQKFALELNQLNQKLVLAFAPIKGKTMLVYHPAFGYLADEYGFIQQHIEIEGKEPSILELQKIINEAKQQNINVIFVQKQFSTDSAQSISENIGGVVIQIDPLDPDYLSNIENLADTISSKIVGK